MDFERPDRKREQYIVDFDTRALTLWSFFFSNGLATPTTLGVSGSVRRSENTSQFIRASLLAIVYVYLDARVAIAGVSLANPCWPLGTR